MNHSYNVQLWEYHTCTFDIQEVAILTDSQNNLLDGHGNQEIQSNLH